MVDEAAHDSDERLLQLIGVADRSSADDAEVAAPLELVTATSSSESITAPRNRRTSEASYPSVVAEGSHDTTPSARTSTEDRTPEQEAVTGSSTRTEESPHDDDANDEEEEEEDGRRSQTETDGGARTRVVIEEEEEEEDSGERGDRLQPVRRVSDVNLAFTDDEGD
jgi:hypothetical protein